LTAALMHGAQASERYWFGELPTDSHYLLGVSLEGIDEFLQEIDFPKGYKRDQERLGWLTEAMGNQTVGYDLCEAIKQWSKKHGTEHMSVCEVLKARGSRHVGKATVFWSHLQAKPVEHTVDCMRKGLGAHASQLPTGRQFVWLDYVSLRQSQPGAFSLRDVRALIKKIDCTIAEIDEDLTWLTRLFCLFEGFVTIQCGAKLLCQAPRGAVAKLREQPIKSANAHSRSSGDKALINSFINDTVGFDELDRRLTEVLQQALR